MSRVKVEGICNIGQTIVGVCRGSGCVFDPSRKRKDRALQREPTQRIEGNPESGAFYTTSFGRDRSTRRIDKTTGEVA